MPAPSARLLGKRMPLSDIVVHVRIPVIRDHFYLASQITIHSWASASPPVSQAPLLEDCDFNQIERWLLHTVDQAHRL